MASSTSPSPSPDDPDALAIDRLMAAAHTRGLLPLEHDPDYQAACAVLRVRARQAVVLEQAVAVIQREHPQVEAQGTGMALLDRPLHDMRQDPLALFGQPSVSAWIPAATADDHLAFTAPTPALDLPAGYIVQHTGPTYPLTIAAPMIDDAMISDAIDGRLPIVAMLGASLRKAEPSVGAGIIARVWQHPRVEEALDCDDIHRLVHCCITRCGMAWEEAGRPGEVPLPLPPETLRDRCMPLMTGYILAHNPIPPISDYCAQACGLADPE
jgi:hypothetical protein